jgi:multisubunit Na+/H+ antiporter MnhF subunit
MISFRFTSLTVYFIVQSEQAHAVNKLFIIWLKTRAFFEISLVYGLISYNPKA